ncbi:MAG: hemerythrin family protein [Bdellovibrionaceae bacterium]|nr:hemerythrin family protein [Pseudobdellovibrionaceae bacterium]
MSSFFQWSEKEFGLHVREMDDEHIHLINLMNTLHDSYEKKDPFDTQKRHLDALAQYTVKHFADEEAYMDKVKFPGLSTHKIIHTQLLNQFKGHADAFQSSKQFTSSFFDFLKVWLTAHIRGIDMKYADFANGVKKSS